MSLLLGVIAAGALRMVWDSQRIEIVKKMIKKS